MLSKRWLVRAYAALRLGTITLCVLAAAVVGASVQGQEAPAATASKLLGAEGVRPGICVHIGCGDGHLTAELCQAGRYLVHGLAADRDVVEKAREHILSRGIYGPVSVSYCNMARLPYPRNMVNVIVAEDFAALAAAGLTPAEVVRVLAPYGKAFLRGAPAGAAFDGADVDRVDGWTVVTKRVPPEMDDWPQYRHDPTRAAISADKMVAPPTSLRWAAESRWLAEGYGVPIFVASAGRIFYYMPPSSDRWGYSAEAGRLVARDAFNGSKLWECAVDRPLPLHLSYYRMGAIGDRLLTLLDGALVALDGATGEIVMRYPQNRVPFTYADGLIILGQGARMALDATTGEVVWEGKVGGYDPCIIVDGKIYIHGKTQIVCLDLKTGKPLWRAEGGSIFCYRDGMLFGRGLSKEGQAVNRAYSAEDGKLLWSFDYKVSGHGGRADLFYLGGLAWVHKGTPASATLGEAWLGIDPATGKLARTVDYGEGQKVKHRCYGERATEGYILAGGMDFFDFRTGKHYAYHGGRGNCGFGYMPAYGLVYQGPTLCQCFPQLRGVLAHSGDKLPTLQEMAARAGERLEKGPAYGDAGGQAQPLASEQDWPTLRGAPSRWGGTAQAVPGALAVAWTTDLGDECSSPVVASGKVFVSLVERHQVVAVDADSGQELWRYTAGGPVDSPPTVSGGLVLFGGRDGWVYCLRERDGELVWRLRAAPEDRRIFSRGRIESAWPVHGSVLALEDNVYFTAGRHSEVDGGIFMFSVKPATGEILWQKQIIRKNLFEQVSRGRIGNLSNDVLAATGGAIYMSGRAYDPATGEELEQREHHLWAGLCGFLSDIARPPYTWKHERRYWAYNDKGSQHHATAAGTLLALAGNRIAGIVNDRSEIFLRTFVGRKPTPVWTGKVPEGKRAKAVLLAGDNVFVAVQPEAPAAATGRLLVYAAGDGGESGGVDLPGAPRFDGMAAARGRLYIATQDGKVVCLAGK